MTGLEAKKEIERKIRETIKKINEDYNSTSVEKSLNNITILSDDFFNGLLAQVTGLNNTELASIQKGMRGQINKGNKINIAMLDKLLLPYKSIIKKLSFDEKYENLKKEIIKHNKLVEKIEELNQNLKEYLNIIKIAFYNASLKLIEIGSLESFIKETELLLESLIKEKSETTDKKQLSNLEYKIALLSSKLEIFKDKNKFYSLIQYFSNMESKHEIVIKAEEIMQKYNKPLTKEQIKEQIQLISQKLAQLKSETSQLEEQNSIDNKIIKENQRQIEIISLNIEIQNYINALKILRKKYLPYLDEIKKFAQSRKEIEEEKKEQYSKKSIFGQIFQDAMKGFESLKELLYEANVQIFKPSEDIRFGEKVVAVVGEDDLYLYLNSLNNRDFYENLSSESDSQNNSNNVVRDIYEWSGLFNNPAGTYSDNFIYKELNAFIIYLSGEEVKNLIHKLRKYEMNLDELMSENSKLTKINGSLKAQVCNRENKMYGESRTTMIELSNEKDALIEASKIDISKEKKLYDLIDTISDMEPSQEQAKKI